MCMCVYEIFLSGYSQKWWRLLHVTKNHIASYVAIVIIITIIELIQQCISRIFYVTSVTQ